MPQISPLQMTEGRAWGGMTTKNHIGAIFGSEPQLASKLLTRISQVNFGQDLDSYLDSIATPLYLKTDDDFVWNLQGSSKKNVPLVEARIGGTAVTGTSEPGKSYTEFELVFPENWFHNQQIIVGHKNEKYQMQIKKDPYGEGVNWVYTVELITGDPDLFVPVEELEAGKRFSIDFTLVEDTLSVMGSEINFTSPFKMRNTFSYLRKQHTAPGNMINRPVSFLWKDEKGKVFGTWTQYEDYRLEQEFREEKNKMLLYAQSNKKDDGTYANFGLSGNVKKQGAGLRQQTGSANTIGYGDFNIDMLNDVFMELSVGKLPMDKRKFVMNTGERGAFQFGKAIEDYSQLYTKMNDGSRIFKSGAGKNIGMPLGYGGQFVEYIGPNGIEITVRVDSMYDDPERNKEYHVDGGLAESYRYDIYDIGTTEGEANIRKVYCEGYEDIIGYQGGLRSPFDPAGKNHQMSTSIDGYTMHRMTMGGAMVKDPSRCAVLIPNSLV